MRVRCKKIARQALDQLRGQAAGESSTERLGIELVDLRIKRINLPEGNRQAVYERMRTERERIAERYRSAGLAEKARIESQARRQSDELLARADADAERIRGEGEAEASSHPQSGPLRKIRKVLRIPADAGDIQPRAVRQDDSRPVFRQPTVQKAAHRRA